MDKEQQESWRQRDNLRLIVEMKQASPAEGLEGGKGSRKGERGIKETHWVDGAPLTELKAEGEAGE